VELEIEPAALDAVAEKAISRQIGARGLRAVMEEAMLRIMFTIPSDLTIRKVIITPETIFGSEPKILRDPARPRQRLDMHNS
jgi:ATP-dependent Clp protease ATP-binding subunit ClpX